MMTLGQTIRHIRKRMTLNQKDFATRLGVASNTISQYETDTVVPSSSVILQMLRLADGEERNPLLKVLAGLETEPLADDKGALFDHIREVQRQMDGMADKLRLRTPEDEAEVLRLRFAEAASQVLKSGVLSRPVVGLLNLWLQYQRHPGAEMIFGRAEAFIEVEIKTSRPPSVPEVKSEKVSYTVMIRCPQTKKPVNTNWTIDRASWRALHLERQRVFCPHCLGYHDWTKADAYLRKAS